MDLFAGPLLLTVLTVIELIIIKYIKKADIPWKEVGFNFNSGCILMWFFRGLEVVAFGYVSKYYSLHIVDSWNITVQWVFTFFAWDFCFYWLHRLHHKIPLFWNVHVIHHQGEHFSLSLGIRNSWYSSLTSFPFFAILAFIGVPVEIFLGISSFHYFMQFYNHNNLVKKSGILEYFMTTPAHHRIHHGANDVYLDKNFSGTFIFWDKLFGTFQKEVPGVDIIYGVPGSIKTDNAFWANNIPFMEWLKMKVPNLEIKDSKSLINDFFIGSGGILAFVVGTYYISRENLGLGIQQFYFFMIVFLATIAIGAVSDGKLWGLISWSLLSVVLPIAFILYYSVYDFWGLVVFSVFFLHGTVGLLRIISLNSNKNIESLS